MLVLVAHSFNACAAEPMSVYFLTFRFMSTYVPVQPEDIMKYPYEKWKITSVEKQEKLLQILNQGSNAYEFSGNFLRGVVVRGQETYLIDGRGVVIKGDSSSIIINDVGGAVSMKDSKSPIIIDTEAFLEFGKSLSSDERKVFYDPYRSKK